MRSVLALLFCVSTASAQRVAPAALVPVAPADTMHFRAAPPEYAFPIRMLMGAGGALAGAYAGGMAGSTFGRNCWDCSDSNFGNMVLGAALGSVITSSVLAAAPTLGSSCSQAKRFSAALVGSLLAGVAGGAVGIGSHNLGGLFLGPMTGAAAGRADRPDWDAA